MEEPIFSFSKFSDNKSLWLWITWEELWKYDIKMVEIFISFATNVAQSCRNEQ